MLYNLISFRLIISNIVWLYYTKEFSNLTQKRCTYSFKCWMFTYLLRISSKIGGKGTHKFQNEILLTVGILTDTLVNLKLLAGCPPSSLESL